MADQTIDTTAVQKASKGFKAIGKDASGNLGYIKCLPIIVPTITGTPATDTADINAALSGGNVHVLIDRDVIIDAPLIIYSNTHLELEPGVEVSFPAGLSGVGPQLWNRSAITIQRSIADASISSGSNALSSNDANFTTGDIGRSVVIAGAGALGGPLCAIISGITSESIATLNSQALTTVSGAGVKFYDRDANIVISGGAWDFPSVRASNGTGTEGNLRMQLFFRRIDGLIVNNASISSGANAKYGVCIGDCTRFFVNGIDFDTYSDGVHIVGPASSGFVSNITGTTRDDATALTPIDYAEFRDIQGTITNVRFENVDVNSTRANTFKIAGGTGAPCKNIYVKNYSNTTGKVLKAQIFDDPLCGAGTEVNNLVIENWFEDSVGIGLSSTGGGSATLRNISRTAQTTSPLYRSSVYVGAGAAWDAITLDGYSDFSLSSNYYVIQVASAIIGTLNLNNINVDFNDTIVSRVLDIFGTIEVLSLSNVNMSKGNSLVYQNTGSSIGLSKLSNISADGSSRLYNALTAANIVVNGLTIKNLLNASFYVSGGSIMLSGSGYNGQRTNSSVQRAATETVNVLFPDLPVNLTQVTPYAGGSLYNTNSGLTCGTGPVVSGGTTWKHLVTEAVYTP